MKEKLIQICDIRLEINDLKKKIEKLEQIIKEPVGDSVEGSNKSFPYEKSHFKLRGVEEKKVKQLEYYKTILESRNNKLLEIQVEVEKFINDIPTSRLRMIFTYRYIDQFSWNKISFLIKNSTPESIRKEHDRYLRKIEVCPICPKK